MGPESPGKERVLLVTIMSDPGFINEARTNMRQALINFLAGVCNAMGFKVTGRETTCHATISGIHFSGFEWIATSSEGVRRGCVDGGIDGDQMIAFLGIVEPDRPNSVSEMRTFEAVLHSLKKN